MSGHWLYAFLRYDPATPQRFLVAANLHPSITLHDVRIRLPLEALHFLDLSDETAHPKLKLIEWLSEESIGLRLTQAQALDPGIPIREMPSLSAFYFEF